MQDAPHISDPVSWWRDDCEVSTDAGRLDVELITRELQGAYWAQGRSREVIERSLRHAICFGLYRARRQVGFARVITDRATFAYVADVFVVAAERGKGLGTWLMGCIVRHPDLQGLKRWLLATRDAHEVYRRVGFAELAEPGGWMERSGGGH
jgi:GNAT superfamily N-acetyltransferase